MNVEQALALTCPFQPEAPGLNLAHKAVVAFVVKKSGMYEVKETNHDEKVGVENRPKEVCLVCLNCFPALASTHENTKAADGLATNTRGKVLGS